MRESESSHSWRTIVAITLICPLVRVHLAIIPVYVPDLTRQPAKPRFAKPGQRPVRAWTGTSPCIPLRRGTWMRPSGRASVRASRGHAHASPHPSPLPEGEGARKSLLRRGGPRSGGLARRSPWAKAGGCGAMRTDAPVRTPPNEFGGGTPGR